MKLRSLALRVELNIVEQSATVEKLEAGKVRKPSKGGEGLFGVARPFELGFVTGTPFVTTLAFQLRIGYGARSEFVCPLPSRPTRDFCPRSGAPEAYSLSVRAERRGHLPQREDRREMAHAFRPGA